MKKILFILALFCGFALKVSAQPAGNASGNHYTIGDLEKQGKLELTKIYVDMVHKINMLLPYVPFNQKGDAVSLANMGIPNTKDNNDAIKILDASTADHNERLGSTLLNIIPFADKDDIIESILFLQSVIERLEVGL